MPGFFARGIDRETDRGALIAFESGACCWFPKLRIASARLPSGRLYVCIPDWLYRAKVAEGDLPPDMPQAPESWAPTATRPGERWPDARQLAAMEAADQAQPAGSMRSRFVGDGEPPPRAKPAAKPAPKPFVVPKIVVAEIDMDWGKPMKTFRAFLAHAKSESELQIEGARRLTTMILEREAKGRAVVEVVLGRVDYDLNFKRCGSWDGWAQDVVKRQDYVTRDPVYGAIVVTNRYVGRATAAIVGHALRERRPIFVLEHLELLPIRQIRQLSESFRDGWEVQS